MAMDEMRYVHTVAIVLNCKAGSSLYSQVFNKDMAEQQFNKDIKEASEKVNETNKGHEDMSGKTGG